MSHVHLINSQPSRRGATSCPVEGDGSGTFHAFGPETANPNSPAVDAAALGGGFKTARPVSAGDFVVASGLGGSGNAPASVVLDAPGPGRSHAIHGVDFGYSSSPSNGQLTITDGTTTYKVPVTSAGPGPVDFNPPMVFAANAAVSGSLSAGGAGVSGYFGFTGRSLV